MKNFNFKWLLLPILLISLGIEQMWAKEGDVLKTYNTNSSTFTTGYKRQSGDNFVWWGQQNYLGANNATNHGNLKPTAADLPVVKAQNSSATTSTTGLYYCYTSEAVANVGALEITFSTKSGSSTVNAYIVTSSTAASSGSATWTKVTLSASSAKAQGANVASANTYRFTFNATETGSKYYGVVFATSSYWRATGFQMKLIEGASSTKTLSSISLSGTLTKSAYVAGESFSPAGLTVTAQYSGASPANVTSAATWTPTGALTAGTNKTMTASYTEGGTTKTATTTINVYDVTTLQARDEDGNAIAAGGPGAPSRTGASISPAADANNYVFKEWAISGASLGSDKTIKSNTITNPTGAVTVTAVYYKPIAITYKANDQDFTTQTYGYGGTLAFPANGPNGDTYSCTGKTFVGWVAEANNNYSHASTAPTYATAGGSVTEAATYYAVFATASGSSKTYSFDITDADFNTTSYAANNNEKTTKATNTSDASDKIDVNWTSNQIYKNGGMQWQKSNGYIYNSTDLGTVNSVTITSTDGGYTITYGTSQNPTTGDQGTGKGYFRVKENGTATGKTSLVRVNFTKSSYTYSNYATTCIQTYTVDYVCNGATSGCPSTTHLTGQTALANPLPTLTKTGYTFGGWYTNSGCTTAATAGATLSANVTLYAKWTANTNTAYTVKHYKQKLDGTYPSTPDDTDNLTGTTGASITPDRKSYTGFTAPNGTTTTILADGSRVVTYQYTRNSYTLTWNLDGGKVNTAGTQAAVDATGSPSGSVKYGASLTAPVVAKEGYTFSAWSASVAATMPAAATAYTASWTANTYKVRFNKNNDAAIGSMEDQDFTYDVYQELTTNAFSLANHTFAGWATTENGSVEHEDEAEVGNLSSTNEAIVNLYAVWTANSHTVTYRATDKTSGTVPVDPYSPYAHGSTVYVLGNTGELAKTYYDFAGWSDGTTTYEEGEDFTLNKDVTLDAVWNCATYVNVSKGTLSHGTFDVNTGSKFTCDGAVNVEVTNIEPAIGYQFSAVTATSGSVDNTTVTFAQYASSSSTINVVFEAKTITVTWNVNGGSVATASSEYTYDGAAVELPTPTRDHYEFAGWYTAAEGGDKITEIGTTNKPSADIEYYAHWTPVNYTVTWNVKGVAWTPYTTTGEGTDGSSSAAYNTKVDHLPTAPTAEDGCGDRFMGWTATENYTGNSAPSDLFTDVNGSPKIEGTTIFHAVFADYND